MYISAHAVYKCRRVEHLYYITLKRDFLITYFNNYHNNHNMGLYGVVLCGVHGMVYSRVICNIMVYGIWYAG